MSHTKPCQVLTVFMILTSFLFISGCVARIGPGAAAPGLFYSNVTYPNDLNPNMSYRINFERNDIEILGPVETLATSRWYFFMASAGDSGYAALLDEAREIGGDGVMNVTVDTSYKSIFLFYARVNMKLTGLAYRYVRSPEEQELFESRLDPNTAEYIPSNQDQ